MHEGPPRGAFMPSAVRHFYSGQPMHFYSGVDSIVTLAEFTLQTPPASLHGAVAFPMT